MTPVGEYTNLKPLLEKMEREDIRVLNFKSKRSRPRLRYFDVTNGNKELTKEGEKSPPNFDPSLPANKTFLEVYNCNNEKPPRKNVMPAEKAIYRTDYVVLFFVHYATATTRSQMGKHETIEKEGSFTRRYKVHDNMRYADEETEATMLHTKAIVEGQTYYWRNSLRQFPQSSKVGVE